VHSAWAQPSDAPARSVPPTERVAIVQAGSAAVTQLRLDGLHASFSGPMTLVATGPVCSGFVSPFTEGATVALDGAKLAMTFHGGSTTFGTIKPTGEFVASDAADTSTGTLAAGATQRFQVLFTLGGQRCPYDATLELTKPITLVAAGGPAAQSLAQVDLGPTSGSSDGGPGWLLGAGGAALALVGGAML
jgi:hypothetical protein